jgi:hypothetical protein
VRLSLNFLSRCIVTTESSNFGARHSVGAQHLVDGGSALCSTEPEQVQVIPRGRDRPWYRARAGASSDLGHRKKLEGGYAARPTTRF